VVYNLFIFTIPRLKISLQYKRGSGQLGQPGHTSRIISILNYYVYIILSKNFIFWQPSKIMGEIVIGKRKIVRQGGHSRMITLPSDFCEANGWNFGNEVIIKTDGKRLILELVE